MSELNLSQPPMADGTVTVEQRLDGLNRYVYQLYEQIQYALNNLDSENFSARQTQELQSYAQTAEETKKLSEKIKDDALALEHKILANADSIRQEYQTYIQNANTSILQMVSENYTAKSEFGDLQRYTSSALQQTPNDITMSFQEAVEISKTNLEDYKREMSTHIRFDGGGIHIGSADSAFNSVFSNSELAFLHGQTKVAWLSGQQLFVNQAEIQNGMKVQGGGTVDHLTLEGMFSMGNAANGFFDFQVTPSGLGVKWRSE